jgi:hypothetical protein
MRQRFALTSLLVALVCLAATLAYTYWVTFMHWHEACYPMHQLCLEGQYVNWSSLEYDTIFQSPEGGGLEECPLEVVLDGEKYKLAHLDSCAMQKLGAEPMKSSDGNTAWMRYPSSESNYELAFGFKGRHIVSFSIKRRGTAADRQGQEVPWLMLKGKDLRLPITSTELTSILGPPPITRRHMKWP